MSQMQECVCCQCGFTDRTEYFRCEACNLYGTIDEYPSDDCGGACWECLESGKAERLAPIKEEVRGAK